MEASLAKLKQMRKGKNEAEKSEKMSDDDKIRLQIKLDVELFVKKFVQIGVPERNESLLSLTELKM